jgi:DNA-damage-inducible protein J
MARTATLNTRIEPEIKKEAQAIFYKLGLSTSEAVTIFLKRVVMEKGIPFEVRIPNEETRKVLKESEAGKNLTTHKSVDDIFAKLGK